MTFLLKNVWRNFLILVCTFFLAIGISSCSANTSVTATKPTIALIQVHQALIGGNEGDRLEAVSEWLNRNKEAILKKKNVEESFTHSNNVFSEKATLSSFVHYNTVDVGLSWPNYFYLYSFNIIGEPLSLVAAKINQSDSLTLSVFKKKYVEGFNQEGNYCFQVNVASTTNDMPINFVSIGPRTCVGTFNQVPDLVKLKDKSGLLKNSKKELFRLKVETSDKPYI